MDNFPLASDVFAIVPAAGESSRMESGGQSKVLMTLAPSWTILHQSLQQLYKAGVRVLVIPTKKSLIAEIEKVAEEVGEWDIIKVCEGGSTRADSVNKALVALSELVEPGIDEKLVLIHDAARPFCKLDNIVAVIQRARDERSGAILAVPATSTIKQVSEEGTIIQTPDRDSLWEAQTPQVFPFDKFTEAFGRADHCQNKYFDDASVFESAGYSVKVVMGDYQNIKVTTPKDLELARHLLSKWGRMAD